MKQKRLAALPFVHLRDDNGSDEGLCATKHLVRTRTGVSHPKPLRGPKLINIKLRLVVGAIFTALAFTACRTNYEPVVNEQELALLKSRTEYPPLLPPEKAHPVTLKLRASPSHLSSSDLEEISSLVGRVPGLTSYEVGMISDSILYPGMIEVFVSPRVVVMKKEEPHWRVYEVHGISY